MYYGLDYFEHTLRKMSATAEDICQRRWVFISEVSPKTILDYGCGVGWFRAFRPSGLIVDTYDIGDYPQTGINEACYDLVCFWDSLEHIPNLNVLDWLWSHTKFVAISIPIKPHDVSMKNWKHYRPPDEHINYFTLPSLDIFFHRWGFQKVKQNQNECPPREDIWTTLYKRNEG